MSHEKAEQSSAHMRRPFGLPFHKGGTHLKKIILNEFCTKTLNFTIFFFRKLIWNIFFLKKLYSKFTFKYTLKTFYEEFVMKNFYS
jgi:hypothetical protein